MEIRKIIVGSTMEMKTNCYIVKNNKKCFIIDPGDDYEKIRNTILQDETKPEFIICTHCHIDHISAAAPLQNFFNIPVYIHKEEVLIYEKWNLAEWLGVKFEKFNYEFITNTISIGDFTFNIKHMPGHTPGSIILINEKDSIMFTGDLLFKNGIGRTDLPGGNDELLKDSLNRLLKFNKDFIIYPGHGENTFLLKERENIMNLLNFL